MTIPTKLILLRILLIPVFLVLFFSGLNIAALLVFAVASLTDFFDSVIAHDYNQMTDFYKIMDPLADKLLIASALIALVGTGQIAAPLAILVIFRDFIITGFRLFAAAQKQVLSAVASGKINTAIQMFLILFILAGFEGAWADVTEQIMIWAVVILTLVSTAENFIRNPQVVKRIIRRS